jgi:hypothetical protein
MTKSQDLELIANSIRNKRSITFMKGLFRTVNQLYRECIDRVQGGIELTESEQSGDEMNNMREPVPTVSIAQLKEVLSQEEAESVIIEIDMVDNVFEKLKNEIGNSQTTVANDADRRYLLAVSLAYANSLLSSLIFPHRRLQVFLFNLSIEAGEFATLQHLLNFRVIMDSTDILGQLSDLEHKLGSSQPWISLARMDMAKRLRKTDVVIECLIKQGRDLELVEYVRTNEPTFPIEKLFSICTKFSSVNRRAIWEQVEGWNITPGLKQDSRPVLSHRVILMNSR